VIQITDPWLAQPYTDLAMLKIETLSDGQSTNLVLTGDLTDESVFQLEQEWRKSREAGLVQVDLCDVGEIDGSGKTLLCRMFSEGVGLVVGAHAH
jgi:ABC-type transporter Mla MlaB component